MNIDLSDNDLSANEKVELARLLSLQTDRVSGDLERVWFLMDSVWDEYGCDNMALDWSRIGKFYAHPVWLLNGLFIEQDDISMGHRHAISGWVAEKGFLKIVDYGGGFGTLARMVAQKCPALTVDIYEPHPSEFGLKRVEEFKNIKVKSKLDEDYDALLSTDVLEHVEDPLIVLSIMIDSVRINGYLVIANCFYPVIKCHLPQNFHFRFTFNLFAKLMGLERIGQLNGSHATIYKKSVKKTINWGLLRKVEVMSKNMFPLIQFAVSILRPIKRFAFK